MNFSEDDGCVTTSDGLVLRFRQWSLQGATKARVVIVHGVAEHSGRYGHVARRLADAGYEVVAYDQRGHGRSEGRRVSVDSFARYSDDLETIRRLDNRPRVARPTFLIGHSMGGTVALAHALEHPDAWHGVVLSSPSVDPRHGVPGALIAVGRLAARVAPRLGVIKLDVRGVSRDPAVVAAYRADPLVHHGPLTAALGAALIDRAAEFPREAPTLAVPLLVLIGGADQLVDPSGMRALFPRFGSQDKSLKEYPGLAHELFNEPEQDIVIADVVGWLDGHLQNEADTH